MGSNRNDEEKERLIQREREMGWREKVKKETWEQCQYSWSGFLRRRNPW